MMVVDASAVLEILARTPDGLELESLLAGKELHAPHLIDLEVVNVVRRWELSGVVSRSGAVAVLEAYRAFRIRRYAHEPLLGYVWKVRGNLTAYDASYLALARALRAELITMDAALRKVAGRRG